MYIFVNKAVPQQIQSVMISLGLVLIPGEEAVLSRWVIDNTRGFVWANEYYFALGILKLISKTKAVLARPTTNL